MEVLTLIGAFCFCIFMSFCVDNMQIFKMTWRQAGKSGIIALPISFAFGFAINRLLPADEAPMLILVYIVIPAMLIPNYVIYKNLFRSVMSGFYASGYMLGMYSMTRSAVHLLYAGRAVDTDVYLDALLIVIFATFPITLLVQRFIKKRIDINILNHRVVHFLLMCAYAALLFIYTLTLEDYPVFANVAYAVFLALVAAMFVLMMRFIAKETALKTERLLTEASKKYISDLEESYRALRTIKHDYVNILSSFKLYIDSKDIDGLAKYYYDELAEMNRELLDQDKLISSLENIKINEIKSVLIYKFSAAAGNNIDIKIEAAEPIEKLGVSTAIVCQILGILLDNAIAATAETEKKKLYAAIVKNAKSATFIIKNHWQKQDIPVEKLFELGFTTKPGGSGMGLYTVRNYTQKINGLYLETELSDEYFTQKLTVKDG